MLVVVVIVSVLVLPGAALVWKFMRGEAPIGAKRDWGPHELER
jgi:hypothetical protein